MAKLPAHTTAEYLKMMPEWSLSGDAISRTYKFGGFPAAVSFVDRVAAVAEKLGHHPDIDIRYDTVILVLSTHGQGGLTEKDFTLAAQINKIK